MSDIISPQQMNNARQRLFARFAALGIQVETVAYPAHASVEQGKALRGDMAGIFTKNLLLKDKKGRLFLLSIHEDRQLDLKTLHRRVGATGQLSFASSEHVITHLGVLPGALTPLGLINDGNQAVCIVLDADLLATEQLNFHPLVNTESTGLHPQQLLSFIRSCAREPLVIDFDQPPQP